MTGATSRINRVIHTNARLAFKPFVALAPDVKHKRTDDGEGEVMALAFQDPDGEIHIFALDQARLEQLKADLAGGIVQPGPSILMPH